MLGIATNDEQRLKYAALNLRMAMEAITYERALAFKDEFPPQEYETWQPRKVMLVLLEIDPNADKDSSLAFGLEEVYGVPAPVMSALGSEKVLNMATLKEHYDALGSYLHVPTIGQAKVGKVPSAEKLKTRCENIIAFIKEVLASTVFNVTLGNFSSVNCIECGKPIRKRLHQGKVEIIAECYSANCSASYVICVKDNRQVEWKPRLHEIKCAGGNCNEKISVWYREMEIGRQWICPKCGGKNTFVLGIKFETNRLAGETNSTPVNGPVENNG